MNINDKIPGCKNFYWKEALYLNGIGACVYVDSKTENNLIDIFIKLQTIRDYFEMPIKVTSAMRPAKYNQAIKGAAKSQHIFGKAVDFKIAGVDCDEVRNSLKPMLEELGLRMEDLPGSNWVHIDTKKVTHNRFFKP